MQLTDTHIRPGLMQDHLRFLNKIIDDQKPDLIIHTGDAIIESSKDDFLKLFDFFESKKIPWTLLMGNHEARALFTLEWLTGELNRRGQDPNSYCKFINLQNDDVHGDCNFAINLVDDKGKTVKQVICMDTNRYRDDYYIWDYIRPDQVEWYERLVKETTSNNNGVPVESGLFIHIPIPEYKEAWDNHEQSEYFEEGGECNDGVKPAKVNTRIFDKIVELKSTKFMTCGHEHANDWCSLYKGVAFCYGVKSSDNHGDDWSDKAGYLLGDRSFQFTTDHEWNPETDTWRRHYHWKDE